jgi:hypothetical protein
MRLVGAGQGRNLAPPTPVTLSTTSELGPFRIDLSGNDTYSPFAFGIDRKPWESINTLVQQAQPQDLLG